MELKNIVIAVLMALLLGSGYFAHQRADHIPPGEVDLLLENGTRALSAEITTLESVRDSLESHNSEALAVIDSLRNRIVAIGTINVSLGIYRDSVQTLQRELADVSSQKIIRVVQADRDTSAVWTETFNNGLFEVTSRVGFTPQSITNHLDLRMLRKPQIDVIVSEGEQGQVTLFARSDDFELDFSYVHQPPPYVHQASWPERNWLYLAGASFVAGVWLGR